MLADVTLIDILAYHGRCGFLNALRAGSRNRCGRGDLTLPFGLLEAVHSGAPLQRDDQALDRLDQQQCQHAAEQRPVPRPGGALAAVRTNAL